MTESLQLDPSDPFVVDSQNLVSAELLGDLLTYTALPVLSSDYLMIPSPTGGCTYCLNTSAAVWRADGVCPCTSYQQYLSLQTGCLMCKMVDVQNGRHCSILASSRPKQPI